MKNIRFFEDFWHTQPPILFCLLLVYNDEGSASARAIFEALPR
jgi:hypothetical protein